MLGQIRCATRGEGSEDDHPNGGVDDAGESVDVVSVDVHVDADLAKGLERRPTSVGIMMMKRNDSEALVVNTGDACVEHGRSRILRDHHGNGRGSRDAIGVKGLGG